MRFWPKKRWKHVLLAVFLVLLVATPAALAYVSYLGREPAFKNGVAASSLTLSSPAFANQEAIPAKYTAQGENVNPPLNIAGIPEGTKSIVITVNDPILPNIFAWSHWVAWNLPPTQNITENTSAGVQGRNSWSRNGYGGPDPMGERSYIFTVYALDDTLNLDADSGQNAVYRAMDSHVLAKGQLIGTYAK
jgi:Raf kinase inhibitor-like YbhB/YbcL family protein